MVSRCLAGADRNGSQVRFGQVAVHIAVGAPRQLVNYDEGGWDEVLGNGKRQPPTHVGDGELGAGRGSGIGQDEVGDGTLLARGVDAADDGSVGNGAGRPQRCLDDRRVDVEAVDLEEAVELADQLDIITRSVPGELAGREHWGRYRRGDPLDGLDARRLALERWRPNATWTSPGTPTGLSWRWRSNT